MQRVGQMWQIPTRYSMRVCAIFAKSALTCNMHKMDGQDRPFFVDKNWKSTPHCYNKIQITPPLPLLTILLSVRRKRTCAPAGMPTDLLEMSSRTMLSSDFPNIGVSQTVCLLLSNSDWRYFNISSLCCCEPIIGVTSLFTSTLTMCNDVALAVNFTPKFLPLRCNVGRSSS